MNGEGYIWIVRWGDFQHYTPERDRGPAWIKQHTAQLSDDRYIGLTSKGRSVLHDLRMLFANMRGRVPNDTRTISGLLAQRVTNTTLQTLNDAGLIEIVSRPELDARLETLYASRAPARTREAEAEKELEKSSSGATLLAPAADGYEPRPLPFSHETLFTQLLALVGNHGDDNTPAVIRAYASRATEGQLAKVLESARNAHPRNRAAYVVAALRDELETF
jgi:hypothetical protein